MEAFTRSSRTLEEKENSFHLYFKKKIKEAAEKMNTQRESGIRKRKQNNPC